MAKKTTKVCVGSKKSKKGSSSEAENSAEKCFAPMTKREAAEVARIARAILTGKFKHNKNVHLVRIG